MFVRPMLAAGLAIALVGCGQAATAPIATPGAPSQAAPSQGRTLAELPTLTLQATMAESIGSTEIVATDDAVWTLVHESATVVRIDPTTNQITAKVELGTGSAYRLGLAGGRLWTYHQLLGEVIAVDPATAKVVSHVSLGEEGDLFWVGDDAAWLIHAGMLNRVDAKTSKVTSTQMPACNVDAAAAGGGFVWMASANGGLCKVDAKTGALVKQATGPWHGTGLALVNGAVWIAGQDNGLVIVDPTTLEVIDSLPPPAPGTFGGSRYSIGIAGGDGSSDNTTVVGNSAGTSGWLRYNGGAIGHMRPGVDPPIVLYAGFPPETLAADVMEAFGSLWVANFVAEGVQRYELPTP